MEIEIEDLEVKNTQNMNLLKSILNCQVVESLKNEEKTYFEYNNNSILFVKIYDLNLDDPEGLYKLNVLYTTFDAIVEKQGLSKIKSVGDSYLVVNIKNESTMNFQEIVDCGFQFLKVFKKIFYFGKEEKFKNCSIGIGVNFGKFSGGIIGKERILFDVFSDDINLCSRMSTSIKLNQIQTCCSRQFLETNLDLDEKNWKIKSRGEIKVKGKGILKTFCVTNE